MRSREESELFSTKPSSSLFLCSLLRLKRLGVPTPPGFGASPYSLNGFLSSCFEGRQHSRTLRFQAGDAMQDLVTIDDVFLPCFDKKMHVLTNAFALLLPRISCRSNLWNVSTFLENIAPSQTFWSYCPCDRRRLGISPFCLSPEGRSVCSNLLPSSPSAYDLFRTFRPDPPPPLTLSFFFRIDSSIFLHLVDSYPSRLLEPPSLNF